jgi:carboxyl-terminal processing protease
VIVSTVGRDAKARDSSEATAGNDVPDVPIAVLTSGNSASASEIVAGALKNAGRAVILGERTFGKGSVQNLYPFADTSRLKLTIARYLTPGDHSIQGIGIGPDVALERAFVLPPKEVEVSRGGVSSKVTSSPTISLFSRDRLQREADLAGHFLETETADPEPTMSLRYLYAPDESQQRTDRQDVTRDVQVMVARDVLAAAKGWRRADVLRTAAPVVQTRAKAEAQRIASAFQQAGIGIDWSTCEAPAQPDVELRFIVSDDGKLDAGTIEPVTLEATNRGATALCQAVGVVKSGNGELDGAEFYFGKIGPGETRRYTLNATLADGYPTETAALSVRLTDAQRRSLGSLESTVETRSMALNSRAPSSPIWQEDMRTSEMERLSRSALLCFAS